MDTSMLIIVTIFSLVVVLFLPGDAVPLLQSDVHDANSLNSSLSCLAGCQCSYNNASLHNAHCIGEQFSSLDGIQLEDLFSTLTLDMEKLTIENANYPNVSMDEGVTTQVTNLKGLSIVNSSVVWFDSKAFAFMTTVEEFQLTFNALTFINGSTLEFMPQLVILNISYNSIDFIAASTFGKLSKLTILDVSYNKLTNLSTPNVFDGLFSLKVLNLSHNLLQYIHPGVFHDLAALTILHLDNNYLHAIREEIFDNLTSLAEIHIETNPWDCHCGVYWLIEALLLDSNKDKPIYQHKENITCRRPAELFGIQLSSVNSSKLVCTLPEFGAEVPQSIEILYLHSGWLHCSAQGDPKPSVYWIGPRGVLVHPTQQTWLPSEIDKFSQRQSFSGMPTYITALVEAYENGSLKFNRFRNNYNGTYTCIIENPLGFKSLSAGVYITISIGQFVLWSIVIGAFSSVVFLVCSLIFGLIRFLFEFVCNSKKAEEIEIPEDSLSDEDYWDYYYAESRDSPQKCVTPAEGVDVNPVKMDLTDDIWETLCDVSSRLVSSVGPKVDYVRSRAHQVRVASHDKMVRARESGSHYVQTLKSSSQQYVRSLRENSSFRLRTLYDSGSTYANRVRSNVGDRVRNVKEHVLDLKDFCATNELPPTLSIASVTESTEVDQDPGESPQKVTTL